LLDFGAGTESNDWKEITLLSVPGSLLQVVA